MLTIQIPDINPTDQGLAQSIRIEIASLLYQEGVWSLGQGARFSAVPYLQFQTLLAQKGIPLNYDEEELEKDFKTIEQFLGE